MNKQPSLKKSFYMRQILLSKQLLTENINTSSLCNANFYMLVLSTLIICIGLDEGLNTIIIAGMVVTPLLGSILSLAYGIALGDKLMMYHTAYNYLGSVLITIIIATLYFALVPASPPQQELLTLIALSYPDIIISIVGGLTVTLGFLFNQKLLPSIGASIATTLTPPICIIGYGISQLHVDILLAALRMFLINSLLIFSSCFILFYIRLNTGSDKTLKN